MPQYIRALWTRGLPDQPIEMQHAVLPDRIVPRMVEVFADGRAEAGTLAHARRARDLREHPA